METKKRSGFGGDAEYADLLTAIFEFMLMSGAAVASIQTIVQGALAEAEKAQSKTVANRDAELATAALVLDAWHRNRRYIDSNANPKAITLLGASPSVEALIRAERSQANAALVARHMRSLGLIVRVGRSLYKPADRIAVISGFNPLVQQHAARSSSNLLRTIKNNVTRPQPIRRLIERFAEVPDLPVSCKREFQQFTRAQGWAFLKTMNDWLELRRARRNPNRRVRTVRAGVHVYAYIDAATSESKTRR